MANGGLETARTELGSGGARVFAFSIDDGFFGIQLDWVEAVYPRDRVAVHTAKSRGGAAQAFIVHRDGAALTVDLRDLFDLSQVLGATQRSAYLVVRSGHVPLALQVDSCLGIQEIDFDTQMPIPSGLMRDGGLCVGHL